ncbi:hypothetical protein M5689_023167 [Euphorbia peplus]|nr:hypothetical protein M5689_023167 [Euphorbia peplus]
MDSLSLLSRLKRAVKKVKLLLHLDIHRWRLVASMLGASPTNNRPRLSFKERPGLRACYDDDTESESESELESNSPMELRRTISYPSEDDIDKKAELFIENFRRQLQIERQISLELKYLQGNNSFKSMSP